MSKQKLVIRGHKLVYYLQALNLILFTIIMFLGRLVVKSSRQIGIVGGPDGPYSVYLTSTITSPGDPFLWSFTFSIISIFLFIYMAVIKRCRTFNIMTGLFVIIFNPFVVYYALTNPKITLIDTVLGAFSLCFIIYWLITAKPKKKL